MVLIESIRLRNVKLNIWKSEKDFITFNIDKLYKDKNGNWGSSNNFTYKDLETLKDLLIKFFNTQNKLEFQKKEK